MKNLCHKIANVLRVVFGWGVTVSLLAGGLTFFGYVAALILGGGEGGLGAQICHVIYKQIFPVITYLSTSMVLLGLLIMYLSGETALTVKGKAHSEHDGER